MRLKELRDQRGLNMRQMSIALNVPYTTYISWEKGERQPNSEMLVILARYFGCTVDYLIGLPDEQNVTYKMPDSSKTLTNQEYMMPDSLKKITANDNTLRGLELDVSGLSDKDIEEVEHFIDLLRQKNQSSDSEG